MPPLSEPQAKDLLRRVLTDLWQSERRPIVGARLKAALLKLASESGSEFDERAIGYAGFADFASKSGVAAVKFRTGTDILIAPADQAEVLSEETPPGRERIRSDFWDAFVSFSAPGEVRGYDPSTDTIVKGTQPLPSGDKPITPVTRDAQVRWREAFIDSLGQENNPFAELKSRIAGPGGLGVFSKALTQNPALRPRWNDFLVKCVREVISDWGNQHGVSQDVWLAGHGRRPRDEQGARARLYTLLDQIPLERLLELRIPLGWLIRRG